MAQELEKLSAREKDCLRLVLTTDAHKQIAFQLGISTNTVDGHLKSAMRKLGVSSSVRAARMLAAHEDAAAPPQSWGDHPPPLPGVDHAALPGSSTAEARPRGTVWGSMRRWLRLPARRAFGGDNDLTVAQRFQESFQAMLFAIFAIGVLVSALSGLGIMIHAFFHNSNR